MDNPLSQGFTAEAIREYLGAECSGLNIHTFETVTSTNAIARQLGAEGAPEGLVIAASAQTEGRGRKGRSFFSPDGTGIYMSLLLRPDAAPDIAVRVTTIAAVSVCQAIERLTGLKPGIKWVNDILLNDRKVCGILTETALGAIPGRLDYVVLGIGVNALEPKDGFPEEIKGIAGSVFTAEDGDRRAQLAAEIISCFFANYAHITRNSFADQYRSRCIVPGRKITVIKPDLTRNATALEVDEECRLLVRYDDDDSTELLYSGEISIRL